MKEDQSNRLGKEPSPYLQQHADNPVDWYPWGEEAFEKARSEQKPIFLSIGYSTCHWCHVMERESFEDAETAELMNRLFVNIKVDREERPDVDAIYMAAAQALTGQGGWPLSAWLTPDLKPYYVGTYFPPRPMHGRPSFRQALEKLAEAWRDEREQVVHSANQITEAISQGMRIGGPAGDSNTEWSTLADDCYQRLKESYDPLNGGFSQAPKFPRPALIEFLHRYSVADNCSTAREMSAATLERMAAGGIYDHVGGGFARYSVDAEWRVPHFEKMLYDQGQLLGVLGDLFRIRQDDWIRTAIEGTIGYLERDLLAEKGGFYSAEDADSEGEEGKFYVWTVEQLRDTLTEEEMALLQSVFEISESGNFEGNIILHSRRNEDGAPLLTRVEPPKREELGEIFAKLRSTRDARVRPSRDEKVIAAWNGLTIGGLARAASAIGDARGIALARSAARFIETEMLEGDRLWRRWKDGDRGIPGFLDDYAFVANGLIDLYEATGEEDWISLAHRLLQSAVRRFNDPDGGGYFYSEGNDPSLILRGKGDYDGAEPAANSVLAMAAARLGRLFDDKDMASVAETITSTFLPQVREYPEVLPYMIAARVLLDSPPRQLVLVADRENEIRRGLRAIQQEYRPMTTVILLPTPDGPVVKAHPELTEMKAIDGKATIYRCENFACEAPEPV